MDKRELRDFKVRLLSFSRHMNLPPVTNSWAELQFLGHQAGKVKNLHVKASVADAANVKYVGGKAARQKAKLAAGDVKGAAALQKQAEEQVEETYVPLSWTVQRMYTKHC